MNHPMCIYCHLPVWPTEPGIGKAFQGEETPKGWLHFDCPEPLPTRKIVDNKIRRDERQWEAHEEFNRSLKEY